MPEPRAVYAALIAARAKMREPKKTATNPHFHSTYAPLDELVDVACGALAAEGLMLSQFTRVKDGRMVLESRILSASGECVDFGDYDLGPYTTPQALGSALTYGRRYTLAAILGLAAEDDDDGYAATDHAQKDATAPRMPAQGKATPPPTGDRKALEARFYAAWKATRTAAQNADPDDWKARGAAVKSILGISKGFAPKMADMTDGSLLDCIAAWTGGTDEPPPPTDEEIEGTLEAF
jgi:hypothetical protein